MRCVVREAASSTPEHPRYLWIVWHQSREKARGFADTEEDARVQGEAVMQRLRSQYWFEDASWLR